MGKSDTEDILGGLPDTQTGVKSRGWSNLWLQPLILFILILAGLIGALVEDGWWDLLFCVMLVYPIYKICYHYYRQ